MKSYLSEQNWAGEVLDQKWPSTVDYHIKPRKKWHFKVRFSISFAKIFVLKFRVYFH